MSHLKNEASQWSAQSLDEGVHVWPISTRTRIFLPYFSWEAEGEVCTSSGPVIGSGKFSKVYRVNWDARSSKKKVTTGRRFSVDNSSLLPSEDAVDATGKVKAASFQDVAIKVMDKSVVLSHTGLANQLKQETRIHLVCRNHPNILNMMRAWQDERHLYMAFELCQAGTLKDVIASRFDSPTRHFRPVPDEAMVSAGSQLGSALAYIHDIGVMHRDVKPENILISGAGDLLLTDFGLALWLGKREKTTSICGTLPYMAPEVLGASQACPYGHSADFWSLGVTLFLLGRGRLPFARGSDHHQMLENVNGSHGDVMNEVKTCGGVEGRSDTIVNSMLCNLLELDGKVRGGRSAVVSTNSGSQKHFMHLLKES